MGKLLLLLLLAAIPPFARLGDKLDQAEARYGLEKPLPKYVKPTPLFEGAKELNSSFRAGRSVVPFSSQQTGRST